MKVISDLHIHGKYSRATSTSLDIPNLEKYAKIKGLNLLGTGDFTHPKWFNHINEHLTEEDGVLRTKTNFPFVWQTEISLMYTQDGKGRRIHHVIILPNKEIVTQFTEELKKKGRIDYDGRPIFGFSSIELIDMLKSLTDKFLVIPAHAWTPYFGIFGSQTGFDSIEECFKERSKYIYAIETGMSSDPLMNWRLSKLDNINLVSFSDSHSFWPWRIGREATLFEIKEITFDNIFNALKNGKDSGLNSTIETDPGYGKYHFDGHRNCNVSMSPGESTKYNNICPVCRKPLTLGVEHRVEELADRSLGFIPSNKPDFKILIPLSELISSVTKSGIATQKVTNIYYQLIKHFDNELNILINIPEEELKKVTDEKIADIILKNREQKLKIKPGYDGVYGTLVLGEDETKITDYKPSQKTLNDF